MQLHTSRARTNCHFRQHTRRGAGLSAAAKPQARHCRTFMPNCNMQKYHAYPKSPTNCASNTVVHNKIQNQTWLTLGNLHHRCQQHASCSGALAWLCQLVWDLEPWTPMLAYGHDLFHLCGSCSALQQLPPLHRCLH